MRPLLSSPVREGSLCIVLRLSAASLFCVIVGRLTRSVASECWCCGIFTGKREFQLTGQLMQLYTPSTGVCCWAELRCNGALVWIIWFGELLINR